MTCSLTLSVLMIIFRERQWDVDLIVFSGLTWLSYPGRLPMTAVTEVTRLLLADNIRHRLVTSGLSVTGLESDLAAHRLGTTAEQGTTADRVRRSMRFLCTELYQRHQMQFDDMLQQLHIDPDTVQVDLETIMADVFRDQVLKQLFGCRGGRPYLTPLLFVLKITLPATFRARWTGLNQTLPCNAKWGRFANAFVWFRHPLPEKIGCPKTACFGAFFDIFVTYHKYLRNKPH